MFGLKNSINLKFLIFNFKFYFKNYKSETQILFCKNFAQNFSIYFFTFLYIKYLY